jgi:1,4-alpha-glucan branching enzyme
VFLFERKGEKIEETIIVALNMVPVPLEKYRIPVDAEGEYRIALNTDDMIFGGSGFPTGPEGCHSFKALPEPWKGRPFHIQVNLPPLGGLYIMKNSETQQK